MARRGMKPPKNRKLPGKVRSKAEKAEKARYERCRRRRKGLIKKLDEFHMLFNAEVYCLIKSKNDQQQVHWYSSEDVWTQALHLGKGAIRMPAPSLRRSGGHDEEEGEEEDEEEEELGAEEFDVDSNTESESLNMEKQSLTCYSNRNFNPNNCREVQTIQHASAEFAASLSGLLSGSQVVKKILGILSVRVQNSEL